ncbi:MAG: ribulose-phosphate 3-epimerase [Desulfomonilia bacterium]|nr:ribulose-phosphate 3-epimerase [Desulfomonilia bacterium]
MISIEASILSADYTRFGEQALEAERAGVEGVQVDVMDGLFVPNITFGFGLIQALRGVVGTFIDVHLMIIDPIRFLKQLAHAGADRIIVHQEACVHVNRVIQNIRDLGVEAGITINPGTPAHVLDEVLDMVDLIQVMTVNPGFGGQEFIPGQVNKIRAIKKMLDRRGLSVPIAVDGGINPATAHLVVDAGASVLVAGSSIFNAQNSVAENVFRLKASIGL